MSVARDRAFRSMVKIIRVVVRFVWFGLFVCSVCLFQWIYMFQWPVAPSLLQHC